MKSNSYVVVVAVWTALIVQCGPRIVDISQHGGSGTETVGITGCATDTNDNPVAGAAVKMRKSDFLDTAGVLRHEKGVYLAETVTDSLGKFHFGSIDTGSYFIEINDGHHHGALVRCGIDSSNAVVDLHHTPLRPTGSISGSIPPAPQTDSMKFSIVIYGLAGHAQITAGRGEFSLTDIAAGAYTIKIIPHIPIYTPVNVSVTVAGGKADSLGQVKMQTSTFAVYPPDSSALRAILDSNGCSRVPIFSIAEIAPPWPHRVTGLQIAYMNFSAIPAVLGKLAELRSLNIQGISRLTVLPSEIGNCKKLRELILSDNQLDSLPETIGDLDSLVTLSVSGNRLEKLPRELGRLQRLEFLDVRNNSIVQLPREIGACRSMKTLIAENNFLSEFSLDTGGCTDLQHLNLSNNALRSLPMSITAIRPRKQFIDVKGNNLCESVGQDVALWLDLYSYDKNWRDSQRCR